ncbi:MAG: LacI family DNA-binding transcriptional regulator [Verrucomicrobia bacterium]|nr:LacI family DNA-binding transcriptional regulator [Verrucomicrobiota bacterium]
MNPAKVTISDLAREAGVSTATVDRVMNSRNGVSARTRDHVLSVAQQLGYPVPLATELLAPVRLDFVLPGGTNTYMNLLAAGFEEEAGAFPSERVCVHRVEGFSPDALSEKLQALHDAVDEIGIVALDHPKVREAVRDLDAAQIPLLAMVSDIPNVPRIGYLGIDNRAAGRLAGYLLGRFMGARHGKVALFAGSLSYRGHEEREMGFRHVLAEEFPELAVLQLQENLDDMERSYTETAELMRNHPNLGGVYNIGAGNRGIARALEESGRALEIVFSGHELTEHSRRFLLSGVMDAVIDQHPRLEAREAIRALARAARGQPIDRRDLAVGMQVIFRDNIPPR